ncbi:hypothetical protein M0R45_013883 [Rubus argutus]|uniref:Uncharacterized protein n=1 Tax=Rubus argutus TaxID=59490 RepID=A0AAW1XJS2_RUBAR
MSSHSRQRASARGNAKGSCLAAGFGASKGLKASKVGLGRGASGGYTKNIIFEDLECSMGGSDDEYALACDDDEFNADECAATVGAFETPAMVRMVQKSQKRNQST